MNSRFSTDELRAAQGGIALEIGKKIKHLRLRLGLTQEELADRCELSKGFISQVERDLTSPSI
ncbi:MAG TPA: helix-turn-helix transcriptional regulator, partial [Clostridia bacterium]|nr:helix-turn-helix transcriptional regulator [Clostridia bacterium]